MNPMLPPVPSLLPVRDVPKPGDFLAIRTGGWPARIIQVGTISRWNHAAIYVGHGEIVEARPEGATVSKLSDYPERDVLVSKYNLSDEQRMRIVLRAEKFARDRTKYGWLDIVALALYALHVRPRWLIDVCKREDAVVCSQLVAICYQAAGVPLAPDPYLVTPGDLAEMIAEE